MEREIREFAIGTALLYGAHGVVPEMMLDSLEHRIGEARDGCRLTYECKTKELYDLDGNTATILRFDERARLKGRFTRIFADALPMLFPELMKNGENGKVSMLIKCPLPDGDALRFYLTGGVILGSSFDLKEGGNAEFELIFGKDAGKPRLIIGRGGEHL